MIVSFRRSRTTARRRVPVLSVRSVVGQMFVLQVVVLVLLVAVAVVALVLQAQRNGTRDARNQVLAAAESFANAPGIVEALNAENPTAVLQPRTEAARKGSGIEFLVVMNTKGIRYTHARPELIGKRFVGDVEPVLRGEVVSDEVTGVLGSVVRAVVPVTDARGRVIGMVGSGIRVERVSGMVNRELPLLLGSAAGALVLVAGGTALFSRRLLRQTHGLGPGEITRMYEHHDAVLHTVREGVLITDADQRLVLANDEASRLLGIEQEAEGREVTELGLAPPIAGLLASGRIATDEVHPVGDRLLVVNNRPTDRHGGPPGSVTTLRDSTELRVLSGRAEAARRRLQLLYDASVRIGTTLEIGRTAEELAQVAVPRFADFVTVDLAEPVLHGEEPAGTGVEMVRTAVQGIRGDHPLYPEGTRFALASSAPQAWCYEHGESVIEPDLGQAAGWRAQDPDRARRVLAHGIHSLIAVPLRARGAVLGVAGFYRSREPEPFDEDDLSVAEELVARTAVCVDNARRYTREHATAVALQRSLLPRALPDQSALSAAYRYLPAQAGVGGDWFDVIPLPGARVALVVGDVVGHGLHAAATMGRLRTAVHNFSALDLPPDELLSHLDELVDRMNLDEAGDDADGAVTGATCLYAVYDPVDRCCALARAGHPPPALVHPGGTVEFPDIPAGPPLGLGGLPFEKAEFPLAEGSQLILYTNGLVEDRARDIGSGLDLLRDTLASHAGEEPEAVCTAVLDALLPPRPSDDIVLIAASTRVLAPEQVATWDVPSSPQAVSQMRAAVEQQLSVWGLDEIAFVTELIISELITNALRYATGPIGVRLIRERRLICEVSDVSSTAPHLRYAATTDEGGRGLFLVAQLAQRWGTRYTAHGKVIWSEQSLPDGA
ncbi:SpoIIE family protein phosphatase [Streptomyces caeni]|uniref:SpoIIE family protein phosphatase n=1 Tax=Streptomyces caeni TaxID=2307231 RepID=A0ABW4IRD7_9ACTN